MSKRIPRKRGSDSAISAQWPGLAQAFLLPCAACLLALLTCLPFSPLSLSAALALVAFLPGYGLLRFIRLPCTRVEQGVLSVLISLCVSTVMVHVAGSLAHRADPAFMRTVVLLSAVACTLLGSGSAAAVDVSPSSRLRLSTAVTLGICLAFALTVTFFSHYITPDNWPSTLKDNSKYLYIIPELQQRIPPRNVFFGLEASQPLGYYYFLHLAMAVLANVGGVSATAAFLAGCLLVTALSVLVPFVLARSLFSERVARWAAVLRTFIGGFDWIPYCLLLTIDMALRGQPWTWLQLTNCDEQWNAWFGARVIVPLTHHWWFPQHELALVISLAWVILMFRKPTLRMWFGVMPFLLVMMAGCSIFYTIVSVPAYGIFVLVCLYQRRFLQALGAVGAGLAALLLAVPYIGELLTAAQRASGGVSFGIVQSLRYPHEWFGCAFAERFIGLNAFTRLLDLPLNYFLEYGIYGIGVAGFILWARRMRWASRPEHRFLFCLAGCAFFLSTFVRAKQGCNEFGYHAHQASMAVAIMLTACWLVTRTEAKKWRPWQVVLVGLALLISLSETHWNVRRLLYPILSVPLSQRHPVAEMAKAVKPKLPANAIVQGIPSFDGIYRPQVYYLPPAIISDTFDAAIFVRDQALFAQAHNMIVNGFATTDPVMAYALFAHLGVTHVIVGQNESAFLQQHVKSDVGLQKFADQRYFSPVYVTTNASLYALKQLRNPPRLDFRREPSAKSNP